MAIANCLAALTRKACPSLVRLAIGSEPDPVFIGRQRLNVGLDILFGQVIRSVDSDRWQIHYIAHIGQGGVRRW